MKHAVRFSITSLVAPCLWLVAWCGHESDTWIDFVKPWRPSETGCEACREAMK